MPGVPVPVNDQRSDPTSTSPRAGAAEPRWTLLGAPEELSPWAAAIDELCARERLPALASSAWLRSFWEGFCPEDPSIAVHLCRQGDRVLAVVPVRRHGRVVRKLTGLENEHFVFWTTAVDSTFPGIGALLLDRLLAGADLLELRRLPLDGPLGRLLGDEARRRGLPVVEHQHADGEVSLPLFSPFPEFEKTVSKNLRRDARLIAKLEAMGEVQFRVVETTEDLGAALPACLELEARGWKGMAGSPILSNPGTHRFYRALAERSAAAGQLRLYLLELAGRIIAFEYDLCAGGRVECLKIAYDESLSRFSPGTILRMLLIRQAIERGEASAYHLGRSSEWKRRWIKQEDRIGTLQIFSDSRRGRLAHLGGPVLRGAVKRLPGVKPLVDRVLR